MRRFLWCSILLWCAACSSEEKGDGLPEGSCCCEHVVEGDIITEDVQDADVCTGELEGGQCITVDPNRLTPHPCCPNATGERCGDG